MRRSRRQRRRVRTSSWRCRSRRRCDLLSVCSDLPRSQTNSPTASISPCWVTTTSIRNLAKPLKRDPSTAWACRSRGRTRQASARVQRWSPRSQQPSSRISVLPRAKTRCIDLRSTSIPERRARSGPASTSRRRLTALTSTHASIQFAWRRCSQVRRRLRS